MQKQYEALGAFYFENKNAKEVASFFGYTKNSFYSLARDFSNYFKKRNLEKRFFLESKSGPKAKPCEKDIHNLIIILRKKYLSVADIKAVLDSQNYDVSETYIYKLIKKEGFARLPRRSRQVKNETLSNVKIEALKTILIEKDLDSFTSYNLGILCFIPYIIDYGIDKLIINSKYPSTKTIPVLNSILCFLALKLLNIRRYTADDIWCNDRGLGLFAGLNVLPKAAWFTSYSHRITREMNVNFLKNLNKIWIQRGLLSDTANLDFVSVPYYGESSHLENNWSGSRNTALKSILAAIAHDPDSGIITYGDTNVRHSYESNVVLEFLDFYKNNETNIKYLTFDSKFTTYQNLKKLDDNGVKFITIRKRGKKIIEEIESLSKESWVKIRVQCAGNKTRQIKVFDKKILLKGYGKEIRQIIITGHGKIKPALIITNDFKLDVRKVVRKYTRRCIVEKSIQEQVYFFHLNRVSSSMVIKVDFDLTMTILANNLYRIFAMDLIGHTNNTAVKLYEKFIHNNGTVLIKDSIINVRMNKKRHHPTLMEAMNIFNHIKISWLDDCQIFFEAASNS